MLDIGGWEFLVVAFVLIMVVGPKELPKKVAGAKLIFQAKAKIGEEDSIQHIANKVHQLEFKHYPVVIENLLFP